MTAARVQRRIDRPGETGNGKRPGTRGVDHLLGLDDAVVGDDRGDPSGMNVDRAHARAIADLRAGRARGFEISGEQRMDIDDAVGRGPHRAFELRVFERRYVRDGALACPALGRHAEAARHLRVAREPPPPLAGGEQQRPVLLEARRLGKVRRRRAEERGALFGQLRERRVGDDLTHHGGVSPGRMHAGNRLLLEDDDIARAVSRKMIRGRSAGEAGADDNAVGGGDVCHRKRLRWREDPFTRALFFHDNRFGGAYFGGQHDLLVAVAVGIDHYRDEFFVELKHFRGRLHAFAVVFALFAHHRDLHVAHLLLFSILLKRFQPVRRPQRKSRTLFALTLFASSNNCAIVSLMRVHRYTQWDGTQQIRFPTSEDLLKHLSDNFLEEEGVRSVKGLRDFLRDAEDKKKELLEKYSPESFKLTPEEAKALSDKLNSL